MNPVRELHINLRDGPLRRINNLNALYQPLHYPLLFPAGGIGGHPEIPRTRPQPFPEEGDDWLWAERDAEEELDPPPEDDSDDEGTEEDSGSSDDEEEATARDSDGEPPTQGYERMLPTQVYQPPAATAATRGRGHGRGRGRGGRARGGGRGRGRGRSDAAAGAAFVQANAGVGREADAAADGGGGGDEGGGDEGGDRVVRTRGTVSCSEWGAYQLQLRPSRSTHIQSSGRLFQELMVDMYCQSENHRVDWVRRNQTLLRAEEYATVVEAAAGAQCQFIISLHVQLYVDFLLHLTACAQTLNSSPSPPPPSSQPPIPQAPTAVRHEAQTSACAASFFPVASPVGLASCLASMLMPWPPSGSWASRTCSSLLRATQTGRRSLLPSPGACNPMTARISSPGGTQPVGVLGDQPDLGSTCWDEIIRAEEFCILEEPGIHSY